jgi:hypothetical protein
LATLGFVEVLSAAAEFNRYADQPEIMKLSLIGSHMISLDVLLMFLSGTGVIKDNIGLFGFSITTIGNVFCWIIPRYQGESIPVLLTTINNK